MKWLIISLIFVASADGQVKIGGGAKMSGGTKVISSLSLAALPQVWANNHECDPPGGIFNVTKTLGTDFTGNAAGINAAISAWASDPDEWYLLQVPVGTYNTSSPLSITSQVTF